MPLVTHAHRKAQQGAGKFTGRADQKRYVSSWAIVEGNSEDRGFPHLRDMLDGVPFGENGEAVQWKEFRDGNDKPHEIHDRGLRLREVFTERDVLDYKNRVEGAMSMARINRFLDEEQSKTQMRGGDVSRAELQPKVVEEIDQDPDAPSMPPQPAAVRPRGWPKGKPRGPKSAPATQPTPQQPEPT